MTVKEIERALKVVEAMSKDEGIDSLLKWVESARYMLKTYGNTEHREEVISDVTRMLVRLGWEA